MFPAYYIFNTLLVTLQMLNVVWTYFIFKVISKGKTRKRLKWLYFQIIYKALTKGEMEDSRSDSEETSEDEYKKEN